ncbi:uncharacterized protein LOC110446158 isoform X2 [Mizuhopecten yessoensis]|nr:uncharacterized protein LOC110446158 isoform X2 [Mizuhopecten yessoensis]
MINMLRRIIYGMFWYLLMTIGVASISPQAEGSNTCVFISKHQWIESQAHQKLHAMNSTQCTTSDISLPVATCESAKNGHVFGKLECFCAGNDQFMQCNRTQVPLCCKYDNVVCLNGGKLSKTESDCNAKPKPIYKCECPPVLDGGGYYQGERCENIPVIRECVYKDSVNVNDSLNSCDFEDDVNRTCIHSSIDTVYECGPARQNVDGMTYKKCERRYNSTKASSKEDVSFTPECNSGENTENLKIALVVVSAGLIGAVIIIVIMYRRLQNRKHSRPQRSLQVNFFQEEENGVDDIKDTDSETDVGEATPERKPFLMRSKSTP